MATPKIPRFAIRFHDKSDQDKSNFTNFCSWMNANVPEWKARLTVISETGTGLGENCYDCQYKVIFMNDPMLMMQVSLAFDFVHPWKDIRKHIHPAFKTMHMTGDDRDVPV